MPSVEPSLATMTRSPSTPICANTLSSVSKMHVRSLWAAISTVNAGRGWRSVTGTISPTRPQPEPRRRHQQDVQAEFIGKISERRPEQRRRVAPPQGRRAVDDQRSQAIRRSRKTAWPPPARPGSARGRGSARRRGVGDWSRRTWRGGPAKITESRARSSFACAQRKSLPSRMSKALALPPEIPVGFVGVGRMGANMARRLAERGFKVTAVLDAHAPAAEELARELGAAGLHHARTT